MDLEAKNKSTRYMIRHLFSILTVTIAFAFIIATNSCSNAADSVTQKTNSRSAIALYTFNEGAGTSINDTSNFGNAITLDITDDTAMTWIDGGGLAISSPSFAYAIDAKKIVRAIKKSNALSIEILFTPNSLAIIEPNPNRIITNSADSLNRNFTFSQDADTVNIRLRTTNTTSNGTPAMTSPIASLSLERTHAIFTWNGQDGAAKIYLNGKQVASKVIPGNVSNWDENYGLGLANEYTTERIWLGDIFTVAIYDRALSEQEVSEYFTQAP